MQGQVILVTGANGGLGTAVTQALLDTGATVVGVSRKIQQSDFPARNFIAMPADARDGEGAKQLVDAIVAKHGRLDALVHLVGGWAGGKPIAESGDEIYREMFDQNIGTAFYFMKAALAPMRKQGSGRIVAIGSRAAVEASPGAGLYGASKAALVSLVRTAAVENKDSGIRVNAILPTAMDTPVNRKFLPDADTSKWVKTGSVASLIVWLLSDAGKDVNGAAVPVLGSDV